MVEIEDNQKRYKHWKNILTYLDEKKDIDNELWGYIDEINKLIELIANNKFVRIEEINLQIESYEKEIKSLKKALGEINSDLNIVDNDKKYAWWVNSNTNEYKEFDLSDGFNVHTGEIIKTKQLDNLIFHTIRYFNNTKQKVSTKDIPNWLYKKLKTKQEPPKYVINGTLKDLLRTRDFKGKVSKTMEGIYTIIPTDTEITRKEIEIKFNMNNDEKGEISKGTFTNILRIFRDKKVVRWRKGGHYQKSQ